MGENRLTVTELAGWGSDTAALRMQCMGRTLVTTLFSSPKANFLTWVLRVVHPVKSCQGVHEPHFINRSFHLEKVQVFGFFLVWFVSFPNPTFPHIPQIRCKKMATIVLPNYRIKIKFWKSWFITFHLLFSDYTDKKMIQDIVCRTSYIQSGFPWFDQIFIGQHSKKSKNNLKSK